MDPSYALLKMIFDNLDYPLYMNDNSGRTLCCNSALLRLYHCSREEFEKTYADVYRMKEDGIYASTIYEQVLKQKEPVNEWNEVILPNHQSRLYYVSQSPIFDKDGNVKYVVGVNIPWETIKQQYFSIQDGTRNRFQTRLVSGEKPSLLYRSQAMKHIIQVLRRIVDTPATILVFGETGVGKEVIANYIHDQSSRSKKSIVALNCAAMSPNLFESEMFGYESGAFTGANSAGKVGLIESANEGTLFLDEIDSLPMELQGKLLRVLETKKIRKVGSNRDTPVDFRLIAATNKDLEQLVAEGKFRSDLYYRLNVLSVTIPPLRERREDIRVLADYFLEKACSMYGLTKRFSPEAYERLESYDWPGNVRELRNVVERTILTSELSAVELGNVVLPTRKEAIPPSVEDPPDAVSIDTVSFSEQMDSFEKNLILQALRTYGSPSNAARKLNISLPTLSRKMSKYGIDRKW